MNIWDLLIFLLLGSAVYLAINILKKNGGSSCGQCNKDCSQCKLKQ